MSLTRSSGGQALASALLLFAAACGDRIGPPASAAELTRISSNAVRSTSIDRYLVYFKADDVPSDFVDRVAALGGTIAASYDAAGLAVVQGLDPAAAAQLTALADVDAVDQDAVFRFDLRDPATIDVTDVGANSPSNPATAFLYPYQWNMRVIRANTAWAAGQLGSPAVKVAIIDTGIDYLHPDLAGLVDLANSASFVPAEDPFVPVLFPGREVFTDLNFHGTHVAATVSSNALLAAGVTSRTTLMAVKVLNVNGDAAISGIVAGIIHATDRGAHILNLSLGVEELLDRQDPAVRAFERALNRILRYTKSRDVAIVASAGNESQDLDQNQIFKVFCDAAHVICVSATGPTQGGTAGPWQNIDALASYSNFGHTAIDVAAPGGNGNSFVVGPCSRTSLVIPVCQTSLIAIGVAGTSQAAPHVSGLAALLLAQHGGMSPSQLKAKLGNSADDLGPKGRDDAYGRGRINVRAALGL